MGGFMEVKLEGMSGALNKIRALKDRINDQVMKAVLAGAIDVEADAKDLCPVDTGRLQNSITHTEPKAVLGAEISAKVGSNLEYAPAVEFGTKPHLAPVGNWPGKHGFAKSVHFLFVSGKKQPYLYPALQKNFNQISKRIEKAVKETEKTK